MPIKIMIVDDHEIVRAGLIALLNKVSEFLVIGEASSPAEAIAKANLLRPEVVIMDIRMPGGSGVEACREILARQPETKILMLTSHSDSEAIFGSIVAGAKGYVLKQIASEELIGAIRQVYEGKSLIDPNVTQKVFDLLKCKCKPGGGEEEAEEALSSQEEYILRLIAQGKTNKEIAKELFLSENTVRNYVSGILAKLKLTNRSQAAVYASRLLVK